MVPSGSADRAAAVTNGVVRGIRGPTEPPDQRDKDRDSQSEDRDHGDRTPAVDDDCEDRDAGDRGRRSEPP